jgi:MFS family permease
VVSRAPLLRRSVVTRARHLRPNPRHDLVCLVFGDLDELVLQVAAFGGDKHREATAGIVSVIVYGALPSIDDALGFSAGSRQWVMSAYLLTFGGLLLLGGRSADLLGRRRMFMVGVSLFAGSSLLCGLAWSDQVLVTARVV